MIEIIGESGERIRNEETALLGFNECVADEYGRIDQWSIECSLSRAIAECNVIRRNSYFSEGILLKCIDSKPLYLYLHYALFKNPDYHVRIAQIDQTIRELNDRPKSQFGAYDEIYAIQKASSISSNKLPSHRHAGYIIILFKLLDEQTRHENLEKSWLNWSGAREIYKYAPRNWNLRRIVLHKLPAARRKTFRPFAYVLFCEFESILNPSNRLQALDMVERLRVRNCGYISLYQVQWSYGHMSNCNETSSSKSSNELLAMPNGSWNRNLLLRGFSQDCEQTATDLSLLTAVNLRHSGGHSAVERRSVFHSYHHFSDIG
ncbi:unnamed protein product [Litomosoides sigmodontis]|uniref:DUF7153 domain-containing protein n=1 Tax=Litomosoides sigmodontis TaxID=42156 RepID=A0A3P6V5E5_LITSI|nr:unnamed protein product [Litomosoides sigmodontis]